MTPVTRAGNGDFEEGGTSEPTQLPLIFQEEELNKSMLDAMRDRSDRSKKKRKIKGNKKWKRPNKPNPFSVTNVDAIREELSCGDADCNDTELGAKNLTHCPVHDDGKPSLQIQGEFDKHGDVVYRGRIWFHCFAGCDTAEIEREVKSRMGGSSRGN